MSNKSGRTILCLLLPIILFPSGASAKIKAAKLQVTTQVSSWAAQKEITRKFPAKGLFEIINGGAEEYIGQGLIEGIHQQFTNKAGKTVEVFVEDFGVPDKARAMYDFKKQSFSETKSIAALPGVQNFTYKAIGALIVVASLENFYIEMTVSGFTDDGESENAAVSFLNYYQKQMK